MGNRERRITKREAKRVERELLSTRERDVAIELLYKAYPNLKRPKYEFEAGWGCVPTFSYLGETPKRHYWLAETFYCLCGQWDSIGPRWAVPEYKEGDTRDPAFDEPDPPDDDPGNCKHCQKVLADRRWAGFDHPTAGGLGDG